MRLLQQSSTVPTRQELLELWRRCLTRGVAIDPRDAVLAELSAYFEMPIELVRQRCLHWEQDSLIGRSLDRRRAAELLSNADELDFRYHVVSRQPIPRRCPRRKC